MLAFERVTIVGVGLLGGSLGLALKHHALTQHISGVGHRESTLEQALRLGAIDDYTTALEEAADADLIVLCTPAAAVPEYLDRIRAASPASTIVTDVASTKGAICRHADDTWATPRRFVGSHPMAGSEKWGPEHSNPNLYHGSVTFVESGAKVDAEARNVVVDLWTRLGAHVVDVDPGEHDALVACTSHLPHVAASALAQLSGEHDHIRHFIGNGWRDATRIAEGRPEIWRDICLTNHTTIADCLGRYIRLLQAAKSAVETQDAEALVRYFEAGVDGRRRSLEP